MNFYISILIRELKKDKFYELVSLLDGFSAVVEQIEKDMITCRADDLNTLHCLLKLKDTYPEIRIGISQYIGLSKGLTKVAKFGEILTTEEIEQKIIENFQIASLGMLSIEGMKTQILVCRVDDGTGEMKFPKKKEKINFIHRKLEIESLKNFLKVTKGILIIGQTGTGKTTFLEQFINEFPDSEFYKTICPPYIPNRTLKPINEIVNQVLGIDTSKSIEEKHSLIEKRLKTLDVRDIATTYLALLDFLGLGEEESILEKLSLKTRFEIITNSIAEILKRISWHKPVIIIVEDVENIDASSVNFIKELMSKLGDENIYFIFSSCRSQTSISGLKEFELREIGKSSLEDFLQETIEERITLPSATPFQVNQYLLLYNEEKEEYFYTQYIGSAAIGSFSLPFHDTRTLIKRRVELLDDKKEFLFALAVFGFEINPSEFPIDQKNYYQFDYFVQKNFLKREFDRYVFASSLLHDEIYNLITDKEERHLRLADYFRRLEGYEECAAFHYQAAGNHKKAIEFLVKSAKLALKKGGYESGINYYNQALEACRYQKDTVELEVLLSINEGLADIYRALGDEDKALQYYKVVLDSYKEILKE